MTAGIKRDYFETAVRRVIEEYESLAARGGRAMTVEEAAAIRDRVQARLERQRAPFWLTAAEAQALIGLTRWQEDRIIEAAEIMGAGRAP
jgi:hypothetical protein